MKQIPVYKDRNTFLFVKKVKAHSPPSQVAYLIDAIRQPKLNGVRGGCSVELRLVKVLPPCSITESCHRTGGTSLLQQKIWHIHQVPRNKCQISFRDQAFSHVFSFFFFFEKRLLAPAASPFFNSIPEVVKKKATFFARKRI